MRGQRPSSYVWTGSGWGLATMSPLFSCLFTASWYFPQFELVYGAKSFQWDGETADCAGRGCRVITRCKWSCTLLPELSPSLSYRPVRCAVSQVRVDRVSVDTVSSHPSSLEVWKYSVTRPPPPPPLPPLPPPPPLSFQNYLSISDKQLHQRRGLRSVNTELPDMIHQWDAVNNTGSLQPSPSAATETRVALAIILSWFETHMLMKRLKMLFNGFCLFYVTEWISLTPFCRTAHSCTR